MTKSPITLSSRFIAGFVCGLLLFVAANANVYFQYGSCMADGFCGFGFPFDMYEVGGFAHVEWVIWSGVVANLFIAATTSTLCGAVFHKLFKPRRPFA